MRTNRALAVACMGIVSLLGLGGTRAGAQHQHARPAAAPRGASTAVAAEEELKVGKKDDVAFASEVRVGDIALPPGTYRIQHRVEGADHYVRFQRLATATPSAQKTATGSAVPTGEVTEVKCQVQPLEDKVRATALHLRNEDGGRRLTRVLIRGENAAHAF